MRTRILFLAVIASTAISQSCKKDNAAMVPTEQDEVSTVNSALAQLGFDTTSVIIKGDNIFVEDDIVLKKSELFKTQPRQAVIQPNTLFSGIWAYRLRSFTYFISNSLGNHRHVAAGMDELRRVMPNNVVITRVYNEAAADLVFRGYNEVSTICGFASWPTITLTPSAISEMIVGESVHINLHNWRDLNESQRKALIAHEVGHAIGIRHTNWRAGEQEATPGPGGATYGAYTVPNTNNTGTNPDPSSIFNGGSCGRSWGGGFTENDRRAIVYVSIGLTI
ncbi:M57 family metalloprotease [Sphingobacterium paludis]|uniref:Dual-action HEIGH metallo-peptidase n=1 Tax=Sphingobacterium paludis TaxID=1476465 RepID=A0A4R7D5T2_9SPHI|nr:M57 family metalloprotease [Sphingobacterium paludis]TDS15722.1 dual-action HEIGH metallo-peptidase [Sphingobacterium paludis]